MSGLAHAAWDAHLGQVSKSNGLSGGEWRTLRDELFPLQRQMLESPARRQARRPGRRGGKTKCNGTELLESACDNPGTEMSLYITLTKHHSRRNLERELELQVKRKRLPIRKSEVDGQLYFTHENGHVIWLTGCKDKTEADKLRGDKYRLAIVDEAGSGTFNRIMKGDVEGSKAVTLLQYLCQSSLTPALSDLDGRLVVSGTPWVLPTGFFYEISTGQGARTQWETYDWTVLDNPHHRYSPLHPEYSEAGFRREAEEDWGCELFTADEQSERTRTGELPYPAFPWLKKASASFAREYMSLWVRDTEALCYAYAESRNSFEAAAQQGLLSRDAAGKWVLPQGDWRHILTIDLGHDDATSFTVASSRRNFPHVYYRRSYGSSEMTTSQRAAEAYRLRGEYGIRGEVVIDQGGLGKSIAHDMSRDYGLPVRAAEKTAKASAIRNLRDAMKRGLVFADQFQCAELIAQWQTVTWNKERTDHDEDCMDDNADGALYNYREHPSHERWDHEQPAPGTQEHTDQQMREHKKRLAQRIKDRNDKSLDPATRRAKRKRG